MGQLLSLSFLRGKIRILYLHWNELTYKTSNTQKKKAQRSCLIHNHFLPSPSRKVLTPSSLKLWAQENEHFSLFVNKTCIFWLCRQSVMADWVIKIYWRTKVKERWNLFILNPFFVLNQYFKFWRNSHFFKIGRGTVGYVPTNTLLTSLTLQMEAVGQLMISALACETIQGNPEHRLTTKQKLSHSVTLSISPLLMLSGSFSQIGEYYLCLSWSKINMSCVIFGSEKQILDIGYGVKNARKIIKKNRKLLSPFLI